MSAATYPDPRAMTIVKKTLVRIEGLHKYFGDHHVLSGIDMTVKQGEVLVLIGPSGSGKSTLLRCMNLWRPSAPVASPGRRTHRLPGKGWQAPRPEPQGNRRQRRDIGMVFQRFNLFPHKTALENIIEAPVQVKGQDRVPAKRGPRNCWTA